MADDDRPLSDPVQAWAAFMYGLVRIFFALSLGLFCLSNYRQGDSLIGTLLGVAVFGAVWWGLTKIAFYPLFAQRGWDQAVFLRTFRRDDLPPHDRQIIQAALPDRVRLVGIRDPSRRTSAWIRFVFEGWTAVRYLGSDRFELEAADRNWLARLQRTLAQSRFAIIDLRDATAHVANEVRLCWKMGNGQRTVFITDESKPQAEWIKTVSEFTGVPEQDLEEATFFALSGGQLSLEQKRDQAGRLRVRLGAIPPGLIPLTGEARAFVQRHVTPADWRTPWTETPAASITVTFVLSTLVITALQIALGEAGGWVLHAGLTAFGVVLFTIAAIRMTIAAFQQERLGRRGGLSRGRSVLSVVLNVIIGFLQVATMLAMARERF